MYCARGDIFRKTVVLKEKNKTKKEKYFLYYYYTSTYIRRGSLASGTPSFASLTRLFSLFCSPIRLGFSSLDNRSEIVLK